MAFYTHRDFFLVTVIGFVVGWLVLLPLTATKLLLVTPSIAIGSVIGFSAFAPLALFVLGRIARRMPVIGQFGKFAAVGTLNTLLNFAVFNTLILWTGVSVGWAYSGFVALAFLVATTNSYFWNKFWTFGSGQPVSSEEYARFALFTLGGALLNVGAASLVVNVIGAPSGIGAALWANVGGLCGVAVSFLWNFIAYRRIVFKSEARNPKL
ncbi:MAG: GtrA family protein [bacterium]|nr:GtrA family protein [bacterium]